MVVKLTGCSDGTVAMMRRVVKWHHNYMTGVDKNPMGERLFTRLGSDLSVHPWSKVNGVRLDLSPEQESKHDAAAKLAKQLNSRMPILRTTDPEVTARALWLYDRDLCPKLLAALQAQMQSGEDDDEGLDNGESPLAAADDMGA
ncbi:hypothetical protein [Bradyrhizobium elkanii]|nr:hypothetical protein [Bradyrhizobium elkanii]MCP1927098.1 hypothetical protein [Bradyrhizobium elkanii]MCS3582225.1 hypothetical protein [Bradyrhizobium elkanii]MCS3715792.1 hypothetical protein [Bradyrhizobium elkanii]MCS4009512.1 hypothetical protein [Bradyrhizobium elkanii USDA 61]BBB95387.1 hypothetical protein BE61_08040 [Bradyrhizobium elkanii USDA 61]